MRDVILLFAVIIYVIVGYFVVGGIDKFYAENYKGLDLDVELYEKLVENEKDDKISLRKIK